MTRYRLLAPHLLLRLALALAVLAAPAARAELGAELRSRVVASWKRGVVLGLDGSYWHWVYDTNGGPRIYDPKPLEQEEPFGWRQVARGQFHTLAIREDGSLWSWGTDNTAGQLGVATASIRGEAAPVRVGEHADWRQVSAAGNASAGVRSDGSLWVWGVRREEPPPGIVLRSYKVPTRLGTASDWAAVELGATHGLARKTDGSLWAWGRNTRGQLGDGSTSAAPEPIPVTPGAQWRWAEAGRQVSFGIRADGSLWSWGRGTEGLLGDGGGEDRLAPTRVGAQSDWVSVSSSSSHALGLREDGSLWGWGHNLWGELGLGDRGERRVPSPVLPAVRWAYASAGDGISLGVEPDGTVWSWGFQDWGAREEEPLAGVELPAPVFALVDSPPAVDPVPPGGTYPGAVDVALLARDDRDPDPAVFYTVDGTDPGPDSPRYTDPLTFDRDTELRYVGIDRAGLSGLVQRAAYTVVAAGSFAVQEPAVAVGRAGILVADGNGQLWQASGGALETVDTARNWVAGSVGASHRLAVKRDGTLWSWGNDTYGNNGQGFLYLPYPDRPLRVGTDTDWVAAAAGHDHSLALKEDGTVWSWGLSPGGSPSARTPEQLEGVADGVAIAAGWGFSAALRGDGTLWVAGPLGAVAQDGWTRLGSDADWVEMAAGDRHLLLRKGDRSLWAVGSNGNGELGTGDRENAGAPVRIGLTADWVRVAAGSDHSAALRSDGSVWTWGRNLDGQLGTGDRSGSLVPVRMGARADWVELWAGGNGTAAVDTTGVIHYWGAGFPVGGEDGVEDAAFPRPLLNTQRPRGPVAWATLPGGHYVRSAEVALQAAGGNAPEIFYTRDGRAPDASSARYRSSFYLTENTTLRFFARDELGRDSPTVTEVYTFSGGTAFAWYTDRDEALGYAAAERKPVLMLAGRPTCGYTQSMYATCRSTHPDVQGALAERFILWSCDIDRTAAWEPYAEGLSSFTLPLVAVIDPGDPQRAVARFTASKSAYAFLSWLEDAAAGLPVGGAGGGAPPSWGDDATPGAGSDPGGSGGAAGGGGGGCFVDSLGRTGRQFPAPAGR